MNRIRLVNVAFNDAKSFFDDFRMTLAGKSTTYDLVNGGGKSVLLMMLLQTVIPNHLPSGGQALRIFLSEVGTGLLMCWQNGYWTMESGISICSPGFARRKEVRTKLKVRVLMGRIMSRMRIQVSGGIDYYNYAIFYDKPEEYDIYSLNPVREDESGKTYMGYDELRSELNRLRRRGCPVSIKDRKGEYMEYIGMHNLISTEWKIIRYEHAGNSIENTSGKTKHPGG